jgi:flagellar basal-body rod modification protein FlgD
MDPIFATPTSSFGFQEAATRAPKKHLEQEDFLKLVMAQSINQNPLEPKGDLEFISQMTQFASLEQMNTMSQNFTAFIDQQKQNAMLNYSHLLGKAVIIQDKTGAIVEGTVNALNLGEDHTVRLGVDKGLYDLADLKQVSTTI